MKYNNSLKTPITFLCIMSLLLVSVITYQTKQDSQGRDQQEQKNLTSIVYLERLLKRYHRSVGPFTVLDYAYGNEDSLVFLVVLYKMPESDSESNFLFVTDLGKGNVNMGADIICYRYVEGNGLHLISSDTIAFSLQDRATGEVCNFTIQYVPLGKTDVLFRATSEFERDD